MPPFILPDEHGELVTLEELCAGAVAVSFHRGHWSPDRRINTRALAEVQGAIAEREAGSSPSSPTSHQFAAAFKAEAKALFPDPDRRG